MKTVKLSDVGITNSNVKTANRSMFRIHNSEQHSLQLITHDLFGHSLVFIQVANIIINRCVKAVL